MKQPVFKLALIGMVAMLMNACATSYEPVPPFTPVHVKADGRALRTQNVVVILDASSSMDEGHQQWKKFDIATALVRNLAETVPADMGIKSGLRIFGGDPKRFSASTQLIDDMGDFDKVDHEKALSTVSRAGGTSHLAKAIDAAVSDLDGLDGKHALFIISDGKIMGMAPVVSATAINEAYAENLCIYPILVGDAAEGQILMDEIARIGGCGFVTNADNLASGRQMATYVRKIFIGDVIDSDGDGVADVMDKCPGTPAGVSVDASGCPLDSDNDGVPDHRDNCPGTPAGVKVDAVGCPITILEAGSVSWTFNDINFAVGKADITSASHGILDEIVAALKSRPALKVLVEGHTDSTGTRDFNMDLSNRRAESVVDYLEGKGISPSRLSAAGYGPDRPIADNGTKLGRSKNRRVQFTKVE